jgi:hypothetical protein
LRSTRAKPSSVAPYVARSIGGESSKPVLRLGLDELFGDSNTRQRRRHFEIVDNLRLFRTPTLPFKGGLKMASKV